MNGVNDGCLDIELLESVDVVNGFKRGRDRLKVSIRESSVKDGECVFNTRPTRPLLDALL
jgi:hypothetical protein